MVSGPDKPHNVALIVPDMLALGAWAQEVGMGADPAAILAAPRTRDLIKGEVDKHSREFKGFEAIYEFILVGEELSSDNEMLTPTLKLKRRNVMARYEGALQALYA